MELLRIAAVVHPPTPPALLARPLHSDCRVDKFISHRCVAPTIPSFPSTSHTHLSFPTVATGRESCT